MGAVQAQQVSKAGLWDERMTQLAMKEKAAYQTYVKSVDEAKRTLDRTLSRLGDQQVRLAPMRDDSAVLVRNTQGAPVTKYHSVGHPRIEGFRVSTTTSRVRLGDVI